MSKELFNHFFQPGSESQEPKQRGPEIQVFLDLLNLISDQKQFPNREINKLVAFLKQLIEHNHVPVGNDINLSFAKITFCFGKNNNNEQFCYLYVPKDFVEQRLEQPELQVGFVVEVASYARDYFCAKYNDPNSPSEETEMRAFAFHAEALNTLLKMAKKKEIRFEISAAQQNPMKDFPNGLADLDEQLWYPTPKYKKAFRPPGINGALRN